MGQYGRSRTRAAYEKERNIRGGRNRNAYVYESTARRLNVQRQMEEPRRQVEPAVRRNRERAHRMSAGYVLFLAVAMCVSALILVNYIQLQAELTNVTRSVAAKQRELNNLKVANDEEYNRIISRIDLEEIKRVAIGELGMIYAQEGQIVFYTSAGNDYMRQVSGD